MKHKGFLAFQLILFIIVSILLYSPFVAGRQSVEFFVEFLVSYGLLLILFLFLLLLIQLVLIKRYYGWKKLGITLLTWVAILGSLVGYGFLSGLCGKGGIPLTISMMYILSTLLIQYCTKKLWMKLLLLFVLFIIFPISYYKHCCPPGFFCGCSKEIHWIICVS